MEREILTEIAEAVERAEDWWSPDHIIKMFADLDCIFFSGYLLGNVLVGWNDVETFERHAPNAHNTWG